MFIAYNLPRIDADFNIDFTDHVSTSSRDVTFDWDQTSATVGNDSATAALVHGLVDMCLVAEKVRERPLPQMLIAAAYTKLGFNKAVHDEILRSGVQIGVADFTVKNIQKVATNLRIKQNQASMLKFC